MAEDQRTKGQYLKGGSKSEVVSSSTCFAQTEDCRTDFVSLLKARFRMSLAISSKVI